MSDEKIVGIVNDLFGAGRRIIFFVLNDIIIKEHDFGGKKYSDRTFVSLLGFDTISTALSWSLMYFVAYPEIQNRLFEEISTYSFLGDILYFSYMIEFW